MLQIQYVWQWPVRITHWINVFCILLLAATGLSIGAPFLDPAATGPFSMGWVRAVHFSSGYLFTCSVLARLIWMLLGNRHASWRAFAAPLTRRGWRSGFRAFKYYTFLSRKTPYEAGHNGLAATIYAGVFLLFIMEIVSGFALYSQYAPGGILNRITGPLLTLVGNQYLRLIHHGILWLLVSFTIVHVYLCWMLDRKMRNGLMSSMFSGFKMIETRKLVD